MGQPGPDNRCQDPVDSKTNDQQQQQQKRSEALSKLRQWQSRISTGMDQILPGLFVGGLREAMNAQLLGENGIRAVVSVHGFSRECQFGPGIATVRLTFSDTSGENVLQHFSAVNSFVHSHRLRQESVLVHCLAGVSRSVCLCLAYLMTVTNLDYPNALDFVGRRHYCAKPNFGFKMQLIKFGQQFVQRERQRLFAEFGHSADQLQELFRNDCIFTNSLFVCGTSTTLDNAFAFDTHQEQSPPQTEEGRRPDDGTSGSGNNSTSNPTEGGCGTAQQQMPMPFMDDEFEADDLHRKCTATDSCC